MGWRKRQTAEMKTGIAEEVWDVGGINNIIQDFRWERRKEGWDWSHRHQEASMRAGEVAIF